MKFKGKVVISKQNLCKKDMGEADPQIEESVVLSFKAVQYAELIGMKPKELEALFEENENRELTKGPGSFILSNAFNIKLAGRHEFTGEKFTSANIKTIKSFGLVINLHCRLKYTEEFHRELPGLLLNEDTDIEMNSVNEQMSLTKKGE